MVIGDEEDFGGLLAGIVPLNGGEGFLTAEGLVVEAEIAVAALLASSSGNSVTEAGLIAAGLGKNGSATASA